jgi:hypothetical protein
MILFTVLILSCNKQEAVFKKLEGTWTLTSYRFKNELGLSYYPESEGTLFFENCDDTVCAYSMNIQYAHTQITGSRVEAGKFTFLVDENKLILTPIVGGTEQATITNGVSLFTKTDLEFQYTDDLGRSHHYIFEK